MTSSQAEIPTLSRAAVFFAKSSLLKIRRVLRDLSISPARRHPKQDNLREQSILSESTSTLWPSDPGAEMPLQAGKIHNLRIALRSIDGIEVPANALFSFWAQLGPAIRWKGYVNGRELREGCLIPAVGGGLCQLSNALYDAALKAGLEIVERHRHSKVIPGSVAESGRDATVYWNYVDLRFKSTRPFRIEASLTTDHLKIRLRGELAAARDIDTLPGKSSPSVQLPPNSCSSCGVQGCFRSAERMAGPARFGRAAWLVDDFWPEFDRYIQENRSGEDVQALPLDGRRYHKSNYAWSTEGFRRIAESRWTTFLRSLQVRRLSSQGADRQRELLAQDQRLAQSYVPLLTHDVLHITLMQNLLPHLWKSGHLGGRTFDVLMTRLPLSRLHERLDDASRRHPESSTLTDFRADPELVEAETEALNQARHVITPHREIAALFNRRTVLLDWMLPPSLAPARKGPYVVFPFSTLARKGAFELRTAAKAMDLQVAMVGRNLEGAAFWNGVRVARQENKRDWLEDARMVVAPAYIENQPRLLLQAIARGVPVIASAACGLKAAPGVTIIPVGDPEALLVALRRSSLERSSAEDAPAAA